MNGNRFILLDGGMGRELQRRKLLRVKTIWSGFALIHHPRDVRDLHLEFIEAGADVITTCNYCVVPNLLQKESLGHRFEELTELAGGLAFQAREKGGRPEVKIAGSLPPLSESYRPDTVETFEEMVPVYRALAGRLEPHIDLFLCETMSTPENARAAAVAASVFGKPVWVSWSLEDIPTGKLRSGETIQEAFDHLSGLDIDAYLFNCCSVESISYAIPVLRSLTGKLVGGYANVLAEIPAAYEMGVGGETPLRNDVTLERYATTVDLWRRNGADIIGGCCGVGPGFIRLVHQQRTGIHGHV